MKALVPLLFSLAGLLAAGLLVPAPAPAEDAQRPLVEPSIAPLIAPREVHLADLRQLTHGGENAEA